MTTNTTFLNRDYFAMLDAQDPLAHTRDHFCLEQGLIYLDGNSLGVLPKATAAHVNEVITQQWGVGLIRSWNTHHWMSKPNTLGDKIGQLIGAKADQTLVCDSTSINTFKLAGAAVNMRPGRRKIVTETGNFSTNLYLLQGLAKLLGDKVDIVAVPKDQVLAQVDSDTVLVLLTHVHFKTGSMWDMAEVTRQVQANGAFMMWDLSHSVGAMPLALDELNVDFAVGCTYKYLNGGPGSPAFLYVAKRHFDDFNQPLTGWLGHAKPFEFKDDYEPAYGVQQTLCGTPSIIAYAALEVAVDLMLQVDMNVLRSKSQQMSNLFIALIKQEVPAFKLASCDDETKRGSQVSLQHPKGYAIVQALIARNIIGDFRAPDNLRFGFTPLYLRYIDVWDAVQALKEIMASDEWNQPQFIQKKAVT